jgi:two-component system response regulator
MTSHTVELPGQSAAVEPSPPIAVLAVEPAAVVLVEDNPADVLLFEEALKDRERQVVIHHVVDAEKALVLLSDRRFQPDLVVLDLNLPRFSGYQVLERYSRKDVPVVVFTSSKSEVDTRCALALGAKEVIHKPGELRPYMDTVREIIDKWIGEAKRS